MTEISSDDEGEDKDKDKGTGMDVDVPETGGPSGAQIGIDGDEELLMKRSSETKRPYWLGPERSGKSLRILIFRIKN